MGYNTYHTIIIESETPPATSLESLTEEWKAVYPDPPLLIDCEFEPNVVSFVTHNWAKSEHIASYISARCKNTDVRLITSGDYFCRYYHRYTYHNGIARVAENYDVCDCQIQVPACLGYENNIYETLSYIPEISYIDRNDNFAVAADVLDSAIELSPDTTGRTLLEDKTGIAYKEALDLAVNSLVKYLYTDSDPDRVLAKLTGKSAKPRPAPSSPDNEDFPF